MSGHADFAVHQEADVVRSGSLLRVGVFFAALILVLTVGSLQPSFAGPSGPARAGRTIAGVEQTPIWQTQVGQSLRERQLRELDRWGWVDRRAGVANIPIDRAIDLVVEESR